MPDSKVVLVVSSDDGNRVTFQVILKREGYRVLEAATANAALEQIREAVPDLVLIQMPLPRLKTADLLRTIRADKSYPHLRVLAIAAEKERSTALEAGADAFHAIPITPQQLTRAVVSLIGRA